MGDSVLILAFVVIVIGGIGSIRGAFLAALLIGLVDTLGRSFAVDILRLVMAPSPARTVGPGDRLDADLSADGGGAVCSGPAGLFPAKGPLRCRRISLASLPPPDAPRARLEAVAGRRSFPGAGGAAARAAVVRRGGDYLLSLVDPGDDLRHRRGGARLPGRLRRR